MFRECTQDVGGFLLEGRDVCLGLSYRLWPLDPPGRRGHRALLLQERSGVPGAVLWVSARRMTIQVKEIDFYLFLNTKENRCSA